MKLISIGVDSLEDLGCIGGNKRAFYPLKERYSNVCLVHLYVLQGAIDNIEYNKLSKEVKRDLKKYCDSIR